MNLKILSLFFAAISFTSATVDGPVDTYRYKLFFGKDSVSQNNAKSFCVGKGGELVDVDTNNFDSLRNLIARKKNQVEFAYVNSYAAASSSCIGLALDGGPFYPVSCDDPAPFICRFIRQ